VTPANVTDAKGFDQVDPETSGLSHADKGYCIAESNWNDYKYGSWKRVSMSH